MLCVSMTLVLIFAYCNPFISLACGTRCGPKEEVRTSHHFYHWHQDLNALRQHDRRHARIGECCGDDTWSQRGCPTEAEE
jgi:hypothetical protein